MILLDELGTGTDPDEGSALACAILQEMRKSGALVFATTHLAEIKGFVHKSDGMVNASMEFDTETLTPFYRLRVGEPGQSHALEIARRYGMPGSIIDTASRMLGRLKVEFDSLIDDLNTKRLQYENSLRELQKSKEETEERERLLHKMLADMKEKQNDILSRAYQEASDIISGTKRQMHALLDDIKKKERKEKQKVIKQVESKQEEISEKLKAFTADDQGIPPLETIHKGDTVYVNSLGYNAFVVDISSKNSRLKVLAQNKEIEVSLSDIRIQRKDPLHSEGLATSFRDESPAVALKLNLIGMRVDEASSKLERFLNDATLSELRELTVVHGVGKGILKRAVHEHLDNHPLVQSYRKGTTEEGGNGVTIVTMK
jgi:DNA mismatch repair protein MutS2